MVTTLRSSIGREAEARRAPHSEQNFASAAFFEPQAEHVTTGEAYVAMARAPNALCWLDHQPDSKWSVGERRLAAPVTLNISPSRT